MRYKRKTNKVGNPQHDYWQSYSDMMAALLLIFILIMSLALIQANISYKETLKQAEQLQEQKEQLNKLLGIKPEIIATLKDELKDFGVTIDSKTGDIQFESDILFDYNKVQLKSQGSEFLGQFMPKYLGVILSEKYLPYIAEIIIEGHTDDVGDYMSNLKLSQDRALSVAQYCIGDKNPFIWGNDVAELRKIVTVNGKSFSNPIYMDDKNTVIDRNRSRRVEIKFRLKDDETISELEKILAE